MSELKATYNGIEIHPEVWKDIYRMQKVISEYESAMYAIRNQTKCSIAKRIAIQSLPEASHD